MMVVRKDRKATTRFTSWRMQQSQTGMIVLFAIEWPVKGMQKAPNGTLKFHQSKEEFHLIIEEFHFNGENGTKHTLNSTKITQNGT